MLQPRDPMVDAQPDSQSANCFDTRGPAILNVPNEILDHIFSFLSIIERIRTESVCRKWRAFGKTVSWCWPTELDVVNLKRGDLKLPVNDGILTSILSRCGRSLKRVELDFKHQRWDASEETCTLTSEVLAQLGKNCPNLQEVRLTALPREYLLQPHLMMFAKACTKLKKVCIHQKSDSLTNELLCDFLGECRSLEYLFIWHEYSINERSFRAVNTKLKGFYMFARQPRDGIVEALLARCDCIEELCLINESGMSITVLMKVLTYYKKTLTVLYLHCVPMEPWEWCEIPKTLKYLDVLSLRWTKGVDDDFIKVLVKNCTKLRSLDLSFTEVTDVGINALAAAPDLRVLNIFGTSSTSVAVKNVAARGLLEKVYFPKNCDENLEANCISVLKCCPNLRVVDVSYSHMITNKLVDVCNLLLVGGELKGPILLRVEWTRVSIKIKCCQRLKLDFGPVVYNELDDIYFRRLHVV